MNKTGSSLANSPLPGDDGKTKGATSGTAPLVHAFVMQSDPWIKYRTARRAALNSNHELEKEYQDILQKIDDGQQRLDSAMLRVDPKLKPIVEKLKTLGARPYVAFKAPKPSAKGKVDYVPATLTPGDWQEMIKTRVTAIQSDPELVTNSKTLADRLIAFNEKLDAAVVNKNPEMASLIAKLRKPREIPSDLLNSS